MEKALVFTGEQIPVVAMLTLRAAIRLYAKTGIKVNSAYTPTRMRNTVETWTGKKFTARDYNGQIAALTEEIVKRGGPA